MMGVSQRGNWKDWIMYMLRAVENTSNFTFNKINDIVQTKIQKSGKSYRILVDSKIYAENTAREYLNRLCEMQVLEKKEISGHQYYLNQELYRILSE